MSLLLLGCASEHSQLRGAGRAQLERCLRNASFSLPFQLACLKESEGWCTARRLERDCATDWTFINAMAVYR